uniref:histo-blood group ABO system transferase 1-like n=1 Tax=Odobenus rosmarus divergens TaxID=9708 RepID=UPI00063C7188|nr:PREDICTED: histo-blood group ABO system transferase 1-like [Odobenus rosmarus divergens]
MVFLELFLQTVEKHFMMGHRFIYYVFTNQLPAGPHVPLWEGQKVVVLEVPGTLCWEDVSMQKTLHPGFYQAAHKDFSYEHWPQSQAHIPRGKGDFYYKGAFSGVSVVEVYQLTLASHQTMGVNLANGTEAVWHDESHLNRYQLDHKPIKVLSPEDL